MNDKKIKEVFIEGDVVNMKRDFFGWRIVHPIKDKNGKMIWMNFLFGGKRGLVTLIFILAIVLLLYFGINQLIANYKIIAEEPCRFCSDCFIKSTPVSLNVPLP